VVALDAEGRPSFNTLQNYGSAGAPLHFFIFDLLVLKGKEVMGEPLTKRRALIEKHVLPKLAADPIRYSPILDASLEDCQCRNKTPAVLPVLTTATAGTPARSARGWLVFSC
jgi:ATP-dependent DNA ligase